MLHTKQSALPKKKERMPLSLICLTLGAFAIGMTEFIIMGLLPNVAKDLDVTIPQAGQLITGYALGVAVGAPLLTLLTHSMPKKRLLILVMCIFIFGNAFSTFAPTYALLMGARILTAFAHGTFLGVGSIIATYLVQPDKRGSAVAIVLAGLTVANIIGVPFGTYIGQQLGWRASFGAITILGIIALMGLIRFIPVVRQDSQSSLVQEIRCLFKPQVLLILFIGALGCGSLFSVFTYITPMLQSISGFKEQSVTWILVLFGIGVTIGNMIGGKLADWKLRSYLTANFAILAVILSVLTVTLPFPVLAVITVFLWGIAAFGIMPGIQLRIMNLASEAPMLAATSSHSALNLGNAAGASLGGLVIIHSGLETVPWLSAALAAIAMVGIILTYEMEKKNNAKTIVQAAVRQN